MLAEKRVVETERNQRDREGGTGQVVISAHLAEEGFVGLRTTRETWRMELGR